MVKWDRGKYMNDTRTSCAGAHVYTAYLKDKDCARGEYREEIDIVADTPGAARRIAREAVKQDYVDGVRVARIEYRCPADCGILY